MFENQYISASEMAEIIGITERAVEKQLAILKERALLTGLARIKEAIGK